jgi:hypothetical protein
MAGFSLPAHHFSLLSLFRAEARAKDFSRMPGSKTKLQIRAADHGLSE